MWERKITGYFPAQIVAILIFSPQGVTKKEFLLVHKSISKQQGDENTEKYQLWDINWCNTKIWEQKLRDMYGKQCRDLVFRSWEYKRYLPIQNINLPNNFQVVVWFNDYLAKLNIFYRNMVWYNICTPQYLISNSPYCWPYNSHDVALDNLVLDQLIIP